MTFYRRALDYNPVSSLAFTNIGTCYLRQQQLDSALYFQRIANAINPYKPSILNNLGLAYYYGEEYDKSEKAWYDALLRDSTLIWPRVFLTRQYEKLGQTQKYERLLLETAVRDDAPVELIRQLGDYHLRRQNLSAAIEAFIRGLQNGLDSTIVLEVQRQHPELQVLRQE